MVDAYNYPVRQTQVAQNANPNNGTDEVTFTDPEGDVWFVVNTTSSVIHVRPGADDSAAGWGTMNPNTAQPFRRKDEETAVNVFSADNLSASGGVYVYPAWGS